MTQIFSAFFPVRTSFWLVLVAFGLTATTAAAATVVRSGEHNGFTRLVVDFSERPEWRLGRSGDRYELQTGRDLDFDLTDVFRRLYAGRLASVENLGDGALGLKLSCICRLVTTELPNQGLVIDIFDGAPGVNEKFEIDLLGSDNDVRRPDIFMSEALPLILPVPKVEFDFDSFESIEARKNDSTITKRTAELRRTLVAQIANGTSQGLIELATPLSESSRQKEIEKESTVENYLLDPTDINENMRIETQVEKDRRLGRGRSDRVPSGPCLKASLVDVGAWYNEDLLATGTGPARRALYDTREQPDPAAHAELARQFIYLTFGAEAISVLKTRPREIPHSEILYDLAALMDEKSPSESSTFYNQLDCDSPSALWALLSQKASNSGGSVNSESIIRTLSTWPNHLRQHLGPRIAKAFLNNRNHEAALAVRNIIERGQGSSSFSKMFFEAELNSEFGEVIIAEEKFERVAASRSHEASDAMVGLLRSQMNSDAKIPSIQIENAKALSFEINKSEGAAALWVATAEALSHNKNISDALDYIELAQGRGILEVEKIEFLRNQSLKVLVDTASDPEFLETVFSALQHGPIGPPARLPIAERLAGLNLPDQSRAVLGNGRQIPTPRERILLSRIALQKDRPEVVESFLTGLSDPVAQTLRSKAISLLNSPAPRSVKTGAEAAGEIDTVTLGILAENRSLLAGARDNTKQLRDRLGLRR